MKSTHPWKCAPAAVVFPTSVDLPDIFHEGSTEHRVEAPLAECALCRAGLCVQVVDDNVVIHARVYDA